MTVDCPLDCPHLRDARKHDRPVPLAEEQIPNREIRVSEEFLEQHEALPCRHGPSPGECRADHPGRRGLRPAGGSSRPDPHPSHARQRTVLRERAGERRGCQHLPSRCKAELQAFRREETERLGLARTRDADVLAILVFFERLELDRNNGRRRGRAFLDFLAGDLPVAVCRRRRNRRFFLLVGGLRRQRPDFFDQAGLFAFR